MMITKGYIIYEKSSEIVVSILRKSIQKLVQILQSTAFKIEGFSLRVFPFRIAVKREKTGEKGVLITY